MERTSHNSVQEPIHQAARLSRPAACPSRHPSSSSSGSRPRTPSTRRPPSSRSIHQGRMSSTRLSPRVRTRCQTLSSMARRRCAPGARRDAVSFAFTTRRAHANPASARLLGSHLDRLSVRAPRRFHMSDAALQRLMAPSGKSRGTSSNLPLVDELAHLARTRLSSADVLQLRDQLTSILESHTGAPAAVVTAVRASRGFEAKLRSSKPVSVRDVCLAFPTWPFSVQANFMKQILRLGHLPYLDEPRETRMRASENTTRCIHRARRPSWSLT